MKGRDNKMFIYFTLFLFFCGRVAASESHREDPHYEWFHGNEVAVREDGIYASSIKGMFKLNVVEYDRVNDRYKVLCSCLRGRGLDPDEALSVQPKVDGLE